MGREQWYYRAANRIAVAIIIVEFAGLCRAQCVPVYGGPTYSPPIGGYISSSPFYPGGVAINGDGIVVSAAERYDGSTDVGSRPVRWGAPLGGASELATLGTDNSGFTSGVASAVNNSGVAVGWIQEYVGGSLKRSGGVQWDVRNNTFTELDFIGGVPFAINAFGSSVGQAPKFNASNQQIGWRAVRWDSSGAGTELGNLGTDVNGVTAGAARSINSSGTAVGGMEKYSASFVDLGERAVRWDAPGTGATELRSPWSGPDGHTDDFAVAINDAGTAVGYAGKFPLRGQPYSTPVRWDASTDAATLLGTLGVGGADNGGLGTAYAINASGTAVGIAGKYDVLGNLKGGRAVRWDAAGTQAIELDSFGTDPTGFAYGVALGINTEGTIVGGVDSYDASGNALGSRAVYWPANGTAVTDLHTLIDPSSGWVLTLAQGISDTGWIAGTGLFDPDGPGGQDAYYRQFAMQVPEPMMAALIGPALVLLAMCRRGHRHHCLTSEGDWLYEP